MTVLTSKLLEQSFKTAPIEKIYDRLVQLIKTNQLKNKNFGWITPNANEFSKKVWSIHYVFMDVTPEGKDKYRLMIWRDEVKVELEEIKY